MQYSTILFDFDGTLTPSLPLWLRAYSYALEQYGIHEPAENIIKECFYKPWKYVVARYELPSEADFARHVHEGLEVAFADALLFDGVATAVETMRSKGAKLGIVTSSVKRVVAKFLKEHQLHDVFQSIITADDITEFKPHPEPVFKALKELEGQTATSILVGDSPVDMLAARNAGIDQCLFFPDEHIEYYKDEDPRSHNPKIVFNCYSQLIPLMSVLDA